VSWPKTLINGATRIALVVQVFAEELFKGLAGYPIELLDCRFQITQKFQYKDLVALAAERARRGLPSLNQTDSGRGDSAQRKVRKW